MGQQALDKPFTGGLGSYKVYVLVAYHIERHLLNGGADRPSEILISLLVRYGCIGENDDVTTTDLEQLRSREDSVSSDGGMCELTPVFRLGDCVDMFRECHTRLFDRIRDVDDLDSSNVSYLSSFIDCFRLREARETSHQRSMMSKSLCRPTARDDTGKVTPGRRVGKVFSKSGAVRDRSEPPKRGPRGGLVPKRRPDLQAKHSLRKDRDAEIIQRAMKNRKNKKKQTRDVALREFASRHSF